MAPGYTTRRVLLDWTLTPEQAALIVRSDERPFALIGRWAGGGAVIGSEPVRVATPADDPFALLDELPAGDELSGAVAGGWFGYLGYQLGARIEPVGAPPPTGATRKSELSAGTPEPARTWKRVWPALEPLTGIAMSSTGLATPAPGNRKRLPRQAQPGPRGKTSG